MISDLIEACQPCLTAPLPRTLHYVDDSQPGLTTLRNRHVEVKGSSVRFQFRGKRGVEHNVSLNDRRLANLPKTRVRKGLDREEVALLLFLQALEEQDDH
ncbi:Eukaryotic DNA topoisomerase I, catalytic core [compost metagenome]